MLKSPLTNNINSPLTSPFDRFGSGAVLGFDNLFGSLTGKELSTTLVSRWGKSLVTGSISIVNGEYQLYGSAWTSDSGTIAIDEKVRIRFDTSASYESDTTVTFTADAVDYPYTATTRAEDTIPSQFYFIDLDALELFTLTESDAITVSGIDAQTTISIIGGEYEINDSGTWASTAGTVDLADTVKVRGTSSASYATAVDVVLDIGTTTDTFTATTRAANLIPDQFTFTDTDSAEVSTVTESDAVTITGIDIAASFTVTGGEAEINDSSTWLSSGSVSPNDTVKVRGTSSDVEDDPVDVVLNINGVSDTFTITAAEVPGDYFFQDGSIFTFQDESAYNFN